MLPFSSFYTAPALCGTWTPFSTNHFYFRPLSDLSLLCFVTFVFFILRCYLYFLLPCHCFLFINSYTLVVSFIPLTWWCLWAKRCSAFYAYRLFSSSGNVYRMFFWNVEKPDEHTWMLPFSSDSTAPALCGTWTPSSANYIYVRLLSHLSALAFVGFVYFAFLTLRCYLFFILHSHLFLFINSCTLSYPSFLLADEASGRNVVLHSILSVFFRLLETGCWV